MKDKVARILIVAGIIMLGLAWLSMRTHAQGPARIVPVELQLLAGEEETYYAENGEYTELENLRGGKAMLTRIDEEGYTWFYALGYDKDKAEWFHIQAWKDRDCDTGGQMSYYIQQKGSLRFRCSTDGSMANESDKKVE